MSRSRYFSILVSAAGVLALDEASAADPFDRSGTQVRGDFDDDDLVDMVASSPEADCGKGALYVLMGAGGSASWTEDTSGILGTAACSDHFGASLAVGDFDGDGYDDLAVGTPDGNDSGYSLSGAVHVIYGSSSGLTATGDQLLHQDTSGIEGVAEVGDAMGEALAVGDFNCDGYDDLAVGVPHEDESSTADVGAVHVIHGSSSGLSTVDSYWYQGAGGVDGTAEANDHFGAALAGGNYNGDTYSSNACFDLAVGAPDEDQSGSVIDSGFLYIIFGTSSGLSSSSDQGIDQNVSGVADTAQTNDQLGFRLETKDLDGDTYDDLAATVPGDGCATSAGWGRHTFHGGSSGLSFSTDAVDCNQFGCNLDSVYVCPESGVPVHASSGADIVLLLFGNDVAYGWSGNDEFSGSLANDVLLGGAGDDALEGAAGADLLIGGAGDDSFLIDLDCEIHADDVVDGGPGSDTVYSHKTQTQLATAGVMLVSIENFVTVSEDESDRHVDCDGFVYHWDDVVPTDLRLSWDELPNDDTVITSTDGLLNLDIMNEAMSSRGVTVRYTLRVAGRTLMLEESPTTLAARASTSYMLDLTNFIPFGVDPELLDPNILLLSNSASLIATAETTVGGQVVEIATAPILFGHAEDVETLKIYRRAALHDTYYGGDLARWRNGATGLSPTLGRSRGKVVVP